MEEEKNGLGREEIGEREGGGSCIKKIIIAKGATIFICNYLGGRGKVLIHHTFLKTVAPPHLGT